MLLFHLAALVVLVAAPPSSTTTVAATYTLIDEPKALYVTLRPAETSLFGFAAHHHVVEARGYEGEVFYDPSDPARCRIEIDIPVSGLVVDRPELRRELGFEKDISEGDRGKVESHMRAEDQLHAERYDRIRFRSRACEPLSDGRFVVDGDLEIRGVTKRIRVPVEVGVEDGILTARSDFSEIHESFGFKPYSAFLGTVANARMIQFFVRARARRLDGDRTSGDDAERGGEKAKTLKGQTGQGRKDPGRRGRGGMDRNRLDRGEMG